MKCHQKRKVGKGRMEREESLQQADRMFGG